jgi:hypothetical protein
MKIRVESKDIRTIWVLRDGPMPEGISIQVAPTLQSGGISITGLKSPVAIISAAANAPIGPLADWLYDKLKDRPVRLTINCSKVDIEKSEIVRVVHEEIAKE